MPVVPGTSATENGDPAPRDPNASTREGIVSNTDGTAVGEGGKKVEEGGGGNKSGDAIGVPDAATTTTVNAAGTTPSEHRREGQNDLEKGTENGAGENVGSDFGNDGQKASPAADIGASETISSPASARRLCESSVRPATGDRGVGGGDMGTALDGEQSYRY